MENKFIGIFLVAFALTASAMPASSSSLSRDRENLLVDNEFNEVDVIARNQDFPYMTLLHEATIDGNVERVRSLIKAGANVHAEDAIHNTPLDYVIEQLDYGFEMSFVQKLIKVAVLLLEAGALVKDEDCFGIKSPLADKFRVFIKSHLSKKSGPLLAQHRSRR